MAKQSNKPTSLAARSGGLDSFRDVMIEKLEKVATDHMTPERMMHLFAAAAGTDSKLMACSVESLASSLLLASQLGLEPSSPLGHLYLIPYGTTCTPVIGYKGMLELIRRTGEVKRIGANVFHQQELDSGAVTISLEPPDVEHKYTGETYPAEDIAGSYCVVEGFRGERFIAICNRSEIEDRRKRSAASGSGPWVTDFAAMARKCAVRKLFGGGTIPISAEKMGAIAQAMGEDGDSERPPVATRAMRKVNQFRKPIETDAEVVEEPEATNYILAIRAAKELGANNADIVAAQLHCKLDAVPIGDWSIGDGDALLARLEQTVGG